MPSGGGEACGTAAEERAPLLPPSPPAAGAARPACAAAAGLLLLLSLLLLPPRRERPQLQRPAPSLRGSAPARQVQLALPQPPPETPTPPVYKVTSVDVNAGLPPGSEVQGRVVDSVSSHTSQDGSGDLVVILLLKCEKVPPAAGVLSDVAQALRVDPARVQLRSAIPGSVGIDSTPAQVTVTIMNLGAVPRPAPIPLSYTPPAPTPLPVYAPPAASHPASAAAAGGRPAPPVGQPAAAAAPPSSWLSRIPSWVPWACLGAVVFVLMAGATLKIRRDEERRKQTQLAARAHSFSFRSSRGRSWSKSQQPYSTDGSTEGTGTPLQHHSSTTGRRPSPKKQIPPVFAVARQASSDRVGRVPARGGRAPASEHPSSFSSSALSSNFMDGNPLQNVPAGRSPVYAADHQGRGSAADDRWRHPSYHPPLP